jgi:dephospho-CoA kinase
MLKVAITGNIGSGKSTVSNIFRAMDVPVFIADIEAKLLYQEEEVKEELRQHFGEQVFLKNGELDKRSLAEIIFRSKDDLMTINQIIHPRTLKKYQLWLKHHEEFPYTLHESAILFENRLQHHFDKTINVTAPEELRMKRIMMRDNLGIDEISARIKNQMSEDEKNKLADYIIVNDETTFLIPQVIEIDKILKQ